MRDAEREGKGRRRRPGKGTGMEQVGILAGHLPGVGAAALMGAATYYAWSAAFLMAPPSGSPHRLGAARRAAAMFLGVLGAGAVLLLPVIAGIVAAGPA